MYLKINEKFSKPMIQKKMDKNFFRCCIYIKFKSINDKINNIDL